MSNRQTNTRNRQKNKRQSSSQTSQRSKPKKQKNINISTTKKQPKKGLTKKTNQNSRQGNKGNNTATRKNQKNTANNSNKRIPPSNRNNKPSQSNNTTRRKTTMNKINRHNPRIKTVDAPNFSPQLQRTRLKSTRRQTNQSTLPSVGKTPSTPTLKIIPLGGLCEVGKNMTVYEYGNDMIIVDVGVAFPEENQPGIDSVIPDLHYVLDNRHKLRGIFLTHGHEDHIGSLSWLLRDVKCPIYGGRMTIELVSIKLDDKGVRGHENNLHVIKAGDRIKVGCFEVESIHVNHSIADAFAFAIYTPKGIVVHSGDFKIDYTPIHGKPIDLRRFAALGEEGVLLFVCESTNIEVKGFSSSERTVGDAFTHHFAGAPGRIIVATFSSNIYRVQQVVTAAEAVNRKVALVGRSMLNVFKAANNLGYIDMRHDTLIDISDINKYPPEELVIITTGSQGEPLAALTRMAFSEHRFVEINDSDTVIISATPIPGNEKPIYRVINELYKRRANVVYSALADIHVSGHAYRDELKILHQLIHPRYFIPAHGEYRHLHMHAYLANEMGQPWNSIYILNNGDILEFKNGAPEITGYTKAGDILIDGSPKSQIDGQVLDQRLTLSDDGVVSIALAVDMRRQKLVGRPIVQTRGFIYQKDIRSMDNEIIKRINMFINKAAQSKQPLASVLKGNALHNSLQSVLYSRTERRPVLLISIIEV